jgi:hypothetical protein
MVAPGKVNRRAFLSKLRTANGTNSPQTTTNAFAATPSILPCSDGDYSIKNIQIQSRTLADHLVESLELQACREAFGPGVDPRPRLRHLVLVPSLLPSMPGDGKSHHYQSQKNPLPS